MQYKHDVTEVLKNPKVHYADNWRIELKTSYRIELFKIWKKNQYQPDVESVLEKDGLGRTVVGPDLCRNLCNSFKASGFPSYKYQDDIPKSFVEENPLVLSGKFRRMDNGKTVTIKKEFERELFSQYPEVDVEILLERAGIDLIDLGYTRLNKIKKAFEEQVNKLYNDRENTVVDSVPETEKDDDYRDETPEKNPLDNPYVMSVEKGSILLKEAFYNEVYAMIGLPSDEIFKIYDLDYYSISPKNRSVILSKILNWNPTDERIDEATELVNRIQRNRTNAMNAMVKSGFEQMSKAYKNMPIESKRTLCRRIDMLPRDVMGVYSLAKVLELIGISRSTYYALLNDDNYGISSVRKANQDELDIEAIRQVLAYKGFEKGIRQVYMLMPKVTGEQFSIYRIRRLMNKYGIRTTIRRPSKNRKAMKELIARNKKANLLMRKFKLHRPNEVRLTDVTYLDYGADMRAYGSASIDPVTGRLICLGGWSSKTWNDWIDRISKSISSIYC